MSAFTILTGSELRLVGELRLRLHPNFQSSELCDSWTSMFVQKWHFLIVFLFNCEQPIEKSRWKLALKNYFLTFMEEHMCGAEVYCLFGAQVDLLTRMNNQTHHVSLELGIVLVCWDKLFSMTFVSSVGLAYIYFHSLIYTFCIKHIIFHLLISIVCGP